MLVIFKLCFAKKGHLLDEDECLFKSEWWKGSSPGADQFYVTLLKAAVQLRFNNHPVPRTDGVKEVVKPEMKPFLTEDTN